MTIGVRRTVMIAGILVVAGGPVFAAGDAEHGRKLAQTDCARCHVLPGEDNMGIGMSPSFKAMVTLDIKDWRKRFKTFYDLRPHPNFVRIRELPQVQESVPVVHPFELTLKDLDDLMAFVDTLAAKYRK